MRLANTVDLRRFIGGDQLKALDQIAYSGCFDCQSLDRLTTAVVSRRKYNKGLTYYLASLYLQLGEVEKARDLLKIAGRATREMKWFSMLMLYCRGVGLDSPRLSSASEQCLGYLQDKYTGSVGTIHTPCATGLAATFADLFDAKSGFAVIGNAPAKETGKPAEIMLREECVSICFNNYHLNSRIHGEADIHVVTPSWQPVKPIPGKHLIITGNSIFYRRSKVWRRFEDRPAYTAIHTVPRELWCSLVTQLGASPSAGLLMLSCLDQCIELGGKDGFVAGFSSDVPTQNHSYDREPISAAHNWPAEVRLRKAILERLGKKIRSLQLSF